MPYVHCLSCLHHPTQLNLADSPSKQSLSTPDEGKTVGGQDFVDGLEVSGTTSVAVAATTGSDTLSLATGVERAARVTGLGADTGPGEASDTSLRVVDSRAGALDGAARDTSGGTGAADAGTDGGDSAAGDAQGALAVAVDGAAEGVSAGSADVGHVGAAREDGAGESSERGAGGGGGASTGAATMACGDEPGGDGEADGAPGRAADEVRNAALDGGEGGRHFLDGLDLELGLGETDLRGEFLGTSGAAGDCLEDDLVGSDIDVPRGDTLSWGRRDPLGGVGLVDDQLVKLGLGLLKAGSAVGHDGWGGASSGDLGGQGLVSDTDVDGVAVVSDPSTGERGAGGGAQVLDNVDGGKFPGNTSSCLAGVESQVALHGSQELRVEVGRRSSRSGVDEGQEGCQKPDVLGDTHV